MKFFVLIIISFLYAGTLSAQTSGDEKINFPPDDEALYAEMNAGICNCLRNQTDASEPMEHFQDCSSEAMSQNKEKVLTFLSKSSTPKTARSGQAMGRMLAEKLGLRLINSCDEFYGILSKMMDEAVPFTDADSIREQLTMLDAMIARGDTTDNQYLFKGLLLMKQKDYALAANAFKIARRIANNPIILYYEAVAQRKKREEN